MKIKLPTDVFNAVKYSRAIANSQAEALERQLYELLEKAKPDQPGIMIIEIPKEKPLLVDLIIKHLRLIWVDLASTERTLRLASNRYDPPILRELTMCRGDLDSAYCRIIEGETAPI